MANILITGMSGTGKSTLLAELAGRGYETVDTDLDGWAINNALWDEERMSNLLDRPGDRIISGTVENQGKFYDRFSHVILLSAPLDTMLERIAKRTDNPYGKSEEQQAEIRHYTETVEPLLRKGADLELSGLLPVKELADTVEELLNSEN